MEISKQAQSKADTHSENAAKRTISVHATGEASCPPDVLQFIVSVSASKDTVEAAQASVRRRTDYILQVLRNNGIKERCIHCSSEISRGESVSMQTDVMVRADSLAKCETVRNLLVEKLDPSVRFTPISFHHTPETKDNKREEAFRKGIANAKSKAQSIAQSMGVRLGPALEVTELPQEMPRQAGVETGTGMESLESDPNKPNPEPFFSLHHRYNSATLVYSSQVAVIFEAHPLRCCSHKKCPKH